MTIPNMLSIIRMVLIPVFVYFYNIAVNHWYAAITLVVSGITDLLDGRIARKFNQESYLGTILDPVADKLTQAAVGVSVMIRYPQIWFLIVIFFVKEILSVGGGLILMKSGRKIMKSVLISKMSTAFFYLFMAVMVFVPSVNSTVIYIMATISSGLLLASLAKYTLMFIDYMGKEVPKT